MASRAAAPMASSSLRGTVYPQPGQQAQMARQPADDYETWYTQNTHNNRMVLSLRSGIVKEIEWALDRLVRISQNDLFSLKSIPGVLDALFEWPWHYVTSARSNNHQPEAMFATPPGEKQLRRFGLASLFVLKNSSVNDLNARELAKHPRTISLVYNALMTLDYNKDSDCEFLINSIEILQGIAHLLFFPTPTLLSAIIQRLEAIIDETTNRSFLICCISAMTSLVQNTRSLSLFKAETAPSLEAAIRCLLLFQDVALISVSLEYLYARLAHPSLLRAFLLHPSLIGTLKVLAALIISTQELEDTALDVPVSAEPTPDPDPESPNYEMTEEELGQIVKLTEPQRSYDWLKIMFVGRSNGEVTQVDFWNLYKEAFSAHASVQPMLPAAEVIKNVSVVFPQAQAMVLPGTTPRFVIRGIARRKAETTIPRLQCHWERSSCTSTPQETSQQLYEHLLEHVESAIELDEPACTWTSCTFKTTSKYLLRRHLLTHIPPPTSPPQTELLVYSSTEGDLDSRPPPPIRSAKIQVKKPKSEPTTNALTSLLIIRLVYRISSATTGAVLRADEEHFGFPGIQEEAEVEQDVSVDEVIIRGEKRGRKAIAQILPLLEQIKINDGTLMGWIVEMIDASLSGDS